jgi:DNA polymerase-3 subunit alpha
LPSCCDIDGRADHAGLVNIEGRRPRERLTRVKRSRKMNRMSDPSFVHLRLHSEYSVVDGIVRLDEAIEAAVADGMPALALTDLANTFGLVKFYKAARKRGVKPIAGCDVWITNEVDRDKPHRLLLLCQTHAGYLNLCELLTLAHRTNRHRGRAELRKAWFSEVGAEDLIALSGAHLGDVGQALLVDNTRQARTLAAEWQRIFPNRYYVELQRLGSGAMTTGVASVPVEAYVQRAIDLAADLELPPVATHPIQFVKPDDFRAHEARVCISEGYILSDQRRPKHFSREQYFKSQAEMAALFEDIPEALRNAVEIAKRCNLKLALGKSQLPRFPTPNNVGLDEYLRARSLEGLGERLVALYPDPAAREAERPRYAARLEFEINTILQMGFPGYFLIVADFINWAKTNGVPVGPGRGSGAGSLVAYSLGITDLDPLRYNLLFERFLNPERVSMPDFDIDFCQDGRDRVIEYVKAKYGAESVSQIATFGTMAAKAVVRDVGRVLEWPYSRADELAKLIPFQPGKTVTLRPRTDAEDRQTIYAREMEPQIEVREQADEETRELLGLAMQLEGLTRNVGMHAGGVLIAPGKLTDFCPLYVADNSEAAISQYDKDDVEAIGLVKFDFLGLTTLTILDWTLRDLRRMNVSLDLASIPLDDPKTYEIFSSANTTAVFQFESRGMRDLLKRSKPDRFGDIIALVALYRPGPMDLIPSFCERKQGREPVTFPDPRVESILSETYGIMVYQEQVMQMAQIIGGYSLGGADLLRRAMGKKDAEEMARHRRVFRDGAAKNGLSEGKADALFDHMEKFAGYGFNKSHAAAYALVAYQTAYMKAHHAAAFMAANMSAVMADTDKVQQLAEDAAQNGLEILRPDVNAADYRFVPLDEKRIRYGLGAIKGTGEAAIGHIVEERVRRGPFVDLFDFCRRVDKRIVNRRVIESLVRAGAFDSVNDHRASLLTSVGIALESAEQASRAANQVSLFDNPEDAGPPIALAAVARWTDRERLQNEKLALGYYLSGHPFEAYARELGEFIKTRLDQLTPQPYPVLLAGIIHSVRIQMTRRGRMAVVLLDDGHARIELTVFNELFEQHRQSLKEDQLLIVEGKVAHDEFSGSLRVSAEKLFDLHSVRASYARSLRITCNGDSSGRKLQEMLQPYRAGRCPVQIVYSSKGAVCEIELGEAWRVDPQEALIQSLSEWLKPENVQVVYPT